MASVMPINFKSKVSLEAILGLHGFGRGPRLDEHLIFLSTVTVVYVIDSLNRDGLSGKSYKINLKASLELTDGGSTLQADTKPRSIDGTLEACSFMLPPWIAEHKISVLAPDLLSWTRIDVRRIETTPRPACD